MSRDRNPDHLHPDIKPLYNELMVWALTNGINVKPIAVWGSPQDQDALYAQGRTTPGKIVTYEAGSASKHCFCLPDGAPASKAFDLGVFENGGAYVRYGDDPRYLALGAQWKAMALEYPDLGLVYGGDWKHPHDTDHFQIA